MANTREDVAQVKSQLIIWLDRYIALLKNNIAAAENCRRAVLMTTAQIPDIEPLTLRETPETGTAAAKSGFVRDLADKIANVAAPGNGK